MKFKSILFLVLGALILAVLFVELKPDPTSATTSAAVATASAPAANSPVNTHDYAIEIRNGAKISGPDVLSATQGDDITLTLRSDHADELHIHGYDLHAHIKSSVPETLRFKADRTGRFTLELHHSNLELGALEVLPR